MISPQGSVYNLFSVCGTVSFRGTEGSGKGGLDEEKGVLVQSVPRKLLFPSRAPLSSICIALLSRSFSRAPLMWGDSEQTLNRARLKACRGATHLCVFL